MAAAKVGREPSAERALRERIYELMLRIVPPRAVLTGKRLTLYKQRRGARYDPPYFYRADSFVVWTMPRSTRERAASVRAPGTPGTRVAALQALIAELEKLPWRV
jgi:hypothetical protein